jgi:hypothetical protein
MLSEFRDFINYNIPDNVVINPEVVMNQFISCSCNCPPVNTTMLFPEIFRKSLDSLSDYFYAADKCSFQGFIFKKTILFESFRFTDNVLCLI